MLHDKEVLLCCMKGGLIMLHDKEVLLCCMIRRSYYVA